MQKTANENDLLSMMSSMQCDIMELKKKNDDLVEIIDTLKNNNDKLDKKIQKNDCTIIHFNENKNHNWALIAQLNATELKLNTHTSHLPKLQQIKYFANLDKLIMTVHTSENTQCCENCCTGSNNASLCEEWKNENITKLRVNNVFESSTNMSERKTKCVKMFSLNNFPNIEILIMSGNSTGLNYDYDGIINELKQCDHKIKKIFVRSNTDNTIVENSLIKYCQKNNIDFSLKYYNEF